MSPSRPRSRRWRGARQEGGEEPLPEPRAEQDVEDVEGGGPAPEGLIGHLRHWTGTGLGWLGAAGLYLLKEQPYLAFALVYGVIRATGTTVRTGYHGLLFSFGRARKVIEPGFRPLIPFLQIVIKVPTRQRSLDLPAQKVTTFDGLVYFCDANLLYRIDDVRASVVEIDELERGMRQMLGLSIQEELRVRHREELRVSEELDSELQVNMQRRLAPWGIEVLRAGFMSIRPSPVTLRLTQLAALVRSKQRALGRLTAAGIPPELAWPLVGDTQQVYSRSGIVRAREDEQRLRRRLRKVVLKAREGHPELLARTQRALLRWLTRRIDAGRATQRSWAKKSLATQRRAVAHRRYGDRRE